MNQNKEKQVQRNSSIELLRILTMIGVIVLHYNYSGAGGGLKYVISGTVNQYYILFTENLAICAVNVFILISAFFLSDTQKRKIIKIVELLIQVIIFQCAFWIVGIIGGNELTLKGFFRRLLPTNYFVILYSALYLITPYVNILIKAINKSTFKKLVLLSMGVFSIWTIGVDFLENICGVTLDGLSTVGREGSWAGYSIVNFLLVYLIGSYIRINRICLSVKKSLLNISLVVAILYGTSLLETVMGFEKIVSWNYNNPFVIMLAVNVFLLFKNIKFENKIVNELAKASFTCFLFHGPFMRHIYVENYVNRNIVILILHQLLISVLLYLASYVVYKIYYVCSHWIIKALRPICDKIDIAVDE